MRRHFEGGVYWDELAEICGKISRKYSRYILLLPGNRRTSHLDSLDLHNVMSSISVSSRSSHLLSVSFLDRDSMCTQTPQVFDDPYPPVYMGVVSNEARVTSTSMNWSILAGQQASQANIHQAKTIKEKHYFSTLLTMSFVAMSRTIAAYLIERELSCWSANHAISPKQNVFREVHII